MYVQIEPIEFPERLRYLAENAAMLVSLMTGIEPDEDGRVEGFDEEGLPEVRIVSDLLDLAYDGDVRPQMRHFLRAVLEHIADHASPT